MSTQQLYLIEIFLDRVTVFMNEDELESSPGNKNVIVRVGFGPVAEFLFKEGQLIVTPKRDNVIENDDSGRRKWSRTIRVGKSLIIPSFPETMLDLLARFPLLVEVWNDDETEDHKIYVGKGIMIWDTAFFVYLKDTTSICVPHPSSSLKVTLPIYAECCCVICGEVTFIVRLTALGDSIGADLQQMENNPEFFLIRTNKAPSLFKVSLIEHDNSVFNMKRSLYEIALEEDPEEVARRNRKTDICTELDSCAVKGPTDDFKCKTDEENEKDYPIDKVKIGDIKGPCGNPNCGLARKVRQYIRNTTTYKLVSQGQVVGLKDPAEKTQRVCGQCVCANESYREINPALKQGKKRPVCAGCGGFTENRETCQERLDALYGTGVTPRASQTRI